MSPLVLFELPKRSTQCTLGGEKLIAGAKLYSYLKEEQGKLIRHDLCEACWKTVQAKDNISHTGYWASQRAIREIPSKKDQKTKSLNLFKQFLEDPRDKEELLFLLALYLARSRQLVFKQEINEEEGTFQIYELSNGFLVKIKKYTFSQDRLAYLQKELSQALEIGI